MITTLQGKGGFGHECMKLAVARLVSGRDELDQSDTRSNVDPAMQAIQDNEFLTERTTPISMRIALSKCMSSRLARRIMRPLLGKRTTRPRTGR